jgi:hypothetical protein
MLNSALADYHSKYLHKGNSQDLATTTRATDPLVVGDLLHATTTTRVEDTTATTTHVAVTPECTKTGGVPSSIVSLTARM